MRVLFSRVKQHDAAWRRANAQRPRCPVHVNAPSSMAGALATSATSGCSSKAQAAARRIARGAGLDRTQIVDLDDPEQAADLRWQESRGPCHMQARGADTAMSNRGNHEPSVTDDGNERGSGAGCCLPGALSTHHGRCDGGESRRAALDLAACRWPWWHDDERAANRRRCH
jgi:hypothetical protein